MIDDLHPNRHAVDRLADTRALIRRLKAREEELRQQVIESGDLCGDEHEARLSTQVQQRVDVGALRRELGPELLKLFVRRQQVTLLKTRRRK